MTESAHALSCGCLWDSDRGDVSEPCAEHAKPEWHPADGFRCWDVAVRKEDA